MFVNDVPAISACGTGAPDWNWADGNLLSDDEPGETVKDINLFVSPNIRHNKSLPTLLSKYIYIFSNKYSYVSLNWL